MEGPLRVREKCCGVTAGPGMLFGSSITKHIKVVRGQSEHVNQERSLSIVVRDPRQQVIA